MLATVSTRVLTAYLVNIQALDLPTYAAALAVLSTAAVLASLLPARRALRIQPMDALRHE